MNKKIVSGIMLTLLLIGMLTLAFNVQPVKAEPRTIIVPDDYPTIQGAINAANPGDVVYVKSGVYYESPIVITKPLKLIGQERNTTIIDGLPITPDLDYIIIFIKDTTNVCVSGFTMRNGPVGIELDNAHNSTISDNIITKNYAGGIRLFSSNFNILRGNIVISNEVEGVNIVWSNNNVVVENRISDNTYIGLRLQEAHMNTVYHNNFINNTYAQAWDDEASVWDDGYPSGGNYWSDHVTVDNYSGINQDEPGSDGIVDEPYIIDDDNRDNYPLMEPWSLPTMIKTLVRTISFWNLNKGTENSLTSKLKAGLHLLEMGNEDGAIHKLMIFINKVEALKGKKLVNDKADQLISEAQRIIDLIEE